MVARDIVALAPRRPVRSGNPTAAARQDAYALPDDLHSALRQFDGCTVVVTGGTGSFGRRFIDLLLRHSRARRLVVFSRDEYKQYEMHQQLAALDGDGRLRFFIGDVRDADRLELATREAEFIVHTAALK